MPAIPGDDFWIGATVEACRVAIADPETYTVLMTGRLERFFKFRVNELLAQKGLTFDEVLLCDGTATELFKKAKLDAFLKTGKYSFIEIWEDRPDHLVSFEEVAKQNGILFKTVLVPKERE